ncbi:hypothetical protein D9613_013013 [Agrocybe pediades]|uniref:Uncharacterized protein n=1 Tax=Agrocybe pediades TaxID=84607 RepID=A0A8H4QWB3_9AGAR|nr:hypothetical protein D9613_013013 [Agrocybe pediades]
MAHFLLGPILTMRKATEIGWAGFVSSQLVLIRSEVVYGYGSKSAVLTVMTVLYPVVIIDWSGVDRMSGYDKVQQSEYDFLWCDMETYDSALINYDSYV